MRLFWTESYPAPSASAIPPKPSESSWSRTAPTTPLLVEEMLREGLAARSRSARTNRCRRAWRPLLAEADCVLLRPVPAGHLRPGRAGQDPGGRPRGPIIVLSGQESEATAVQAVHEGAQDYLVKRSADAHLLEPRRSATRSSASQAELELARRAMYDPLTGIANRVLFTDRLRLALARADRTRARRGRDVRRPRPIQGRE